MLYLHGIGHFYPENIISNDFLEKLDIGSNSEWIRERVGIKNRRTVLPLDYIKTTKNVDTRAAMEAAQYTNAQTGVLAAKMALERAGLQPKDIGLVISSSCIPDLSCPSEASTVAAGLDIEALSFDLNSACSSFGVALNFIDNMKPAALPAYVLLLNVENMTKVINYSDRNTAALWGDGATAAIVSASVASKIIFEGFTSTSDPSGWNKVQVPRMGYFQQNGKEVQNFAIRRTSESIKSLQLKQENEEQGRVLFIGHQANYTMLESVCRRCAISPENHLYNVIEKGNTGSAGAPGVISQHYSDLKKGDTILISVVGGGLTWSSFRVRVEN